MDEDLAIPCLPFMNTKSAAVSRHTDLPSWIFNAESFSSTRIDVVASFFFKMYYYIRVALLGIIVNIINLFHLHRYVSSHPLQNCCLVAASWHRDMGSGAVRHAGTTISSRSAASIRSSDALIRQRKFTTDSAIAVSIREEEIGKLFPILRQFIMIILWPKNASRRHLFCKKSFRMRSWHKPNKISWPL